MLESFPFSVFLGSIFGFLAGIGVGGGSLLVLWLTVVLGMEPEEDGMQPMTMAGSTAPSSR